MAAAAMASTHIDGGSGAGSSSTWGRRVTSGITATAATA